MKHKSGIFSKMSVSSNELTSLDCAHIYLFIYLLTSKLRTKYISDNLHEYKVILGLGDWHPPNSLKLKKANLGIGYVTLDGTSH